MTFAGTNRFQVVRALGQGGMGVVVEVFDREQATSCALKLLAATTPHALLSFKQEFRALQGLSHPNLITLGELLSEGDHWFFTMELVRGIDLLSYVGAGADSTADMQAPGVLPAGTVTLDESAPLQRLPAGPSELRPGFDEAKLRSALRQLLEGLRFLHDAGKVHRDVKPSNVLVTEAGRVVILDFGLCADRAPPDLSGGDPAPKRLVGTPAYMAPENLRAGPVGPAADLYAVGVILFRALTGELPFPDVSLADLRGRMSRRAPRPSEIRAEVPPVLDDLCVELLHPDPAARPTLREVLARLGRPDVPPAPEASVPFVGRRDERQRIVSAFGRSTLGPVLVALEGPSGIGKTALLAEVLTELAARAERPLVLRGRCYEHEGIPYKAIDGVMDELGEHLARPPSMPDLPADARLLGLLFPVLRPVLGFVPPARTGAAEASDAIELRRQAERAGRSLFRALAAVRPLIIAIDDFQWADADSTTFLAALARPPRPPPLLLVLSSRTEITLALGDRVERIALAPLPPPDARELAVCLLGRARRGDLQSAEAIAREAAGNPFFMNELVWRPIPPGAGLCPRLEEVLWERINRCQGAARGLLELVAVGARPINQKIVAEAAGLDAAAFTRATLELRAEHLVRTTGVNPTDDVETYHDRVRETVTAGLSAAARADRHLTLARAFERQRPDDLEALVTHFEGGGDGARAASYAIRAGDRAAAALAFERAAAFYRRAIARLPPAVVGDQRLHLKLADALANAGLGAEAAVEYERAAEGCPPALALELRRRAAEHLLRSGRLEEGMAALSAVLAQVKVRVPATPAGALASLLLHRGRVRLRGLGFNERPAAEIPAADLVRVDTLWAATARLGAIDTIRATDFQARHLLLSLDLGEPFRIARALVAEATFGSTGGPAQRGPTARLLAQAAALITRLEYPYATALLQFARGLSDYQFGAYRPAQLALDRAAELFQTTCTGVSHDIAVSNRFAIDCLFNLGELAQMRQRVPLLLDDAQRRGDLYLAAELQTGLPNVVWLASDEPEQSRRATDQAIARWSSRSFYLQHYYHALASAHIALYLGDGKGAHEIVEQIWPGLKRSLLLRVQAVRAEALFLRARAAIADGSGGALAIATKAVAALARQDIPAAAGLSAAARAGLAARRGDDAAAAVNLQQAADALVAADVGMHAAACRMHLGRLARGPAAAEMVAEANAWMGARGIVRPERFARLLVPGLPD